MSVCLKIHEWKLIGSFMVNTFHEHFVENPLESFAVKLLKTFNKTT